MVPPPEGRGQLPVIGYFAEPTPTGIWIKVYYAAPSDAVHESIHRASEKYSHPCFTSAKVSPAGADWISVTPELTWAPEELGDTKKAEGCRLGVGYKLHKASVTAATANTTIVTDSAIVDKDGTEIMPAAPGNVVPKLTEELRTAP